MSRVYFRSTAFLIICAFLFARCTKLDNTSVGSDLIPGVDNIHTFDTTLNVIANNFDAANECDSISRSDLLAIGLIRDNLLFGSSRAEGYFSFLPASYPLSIPVHDASSLVIDSVVLVLKYDHTYGDTNAVQSVNVFQLTTPLQADSAYKTCQEQLFSPDVLGTAVFTPAMLKDSIHAYKEDDANQLRIRLHEQFGKDLIDKSGDLTNDTLFREFLKGFAVVPESSPSGGRAMSYFSLLSGSSRLSIYIRYEADSKADTSVINLNFTDKAAQANYIERDRGNAEMNQYLDMSPEGDSLIFIQSYPAGTYAKLKIPELPDLPNAVVNRAELIIQQVYDVTAADFAAPRLLYIDVPDTGGLYIPIPCDFSMDELQSGFRNLGGIRANVDDGNGRQIAKYTFNISRYVQSVITKKAENSTLRLRAPFYIENFKSYVDRCGQPITSFSVNGNYAADGSVKLNGTNATATRIRLRIIYSKI